MLLVTVSYASHINDPFGYGKSYFLRNHMHSSQNRNRFVIHEPYAIKYPGLVYSGLRMRSFSYDRLPYEDQPIFADDKGVLLEYDNLGFGNAVSFNYKFF